MRFTCTTTDRYQDKIVALNIEKKESWVSIILTKRFEREICVILSQQLRIIKFSSEREVVSLLQKGLT